MSQIFDVFTPPSREGMSLGGAGSWQRLFCASAPSLSLFFCRSLCCQEIPLPSLLGDAVLDCGPPTSDLLPTDMCTSFSDCTYMTAVPVVLSVMLTPTPPVGLLPPHMQAQVVQHYSFHLVVYKPQVWQHERTHRCCISMNTCSGYTIRLFTFFCKTFIPVRVSSYIIQYLLYTHKNMALPYFLCCQEICRILLWPCMIHFFCVSSPRPTTRRNQLTVTCGKLLWEKLWQQRMWKKKCSSTYSMQSRLFWAVSYTETTSIINKGTCLNNIYPKISIV